MTPDYVTRESIVRAHLEERTGELQHWTDDDLTRPAQENDRATGYAVACRVTYTDEYGGPMDDYWLGSEADDAFVRDCIGISLHDDVYGIAWYAVDPSTAEITSPRPLAVFQYGQAMPR